MLRDVLAGVLFALALFATLFLAGVGISRLCLPPPRPAPCACPAPCECCPGDDCGCCRK